MEEALRECLDYTLPELLTGLEVGSSRLPAEEDFHFYSNFKEFRAPVAEVKSRVEALFRLVASSGLFPRAPAWPPAEDVPEWVVEVQDEALECVDSALDELVKEKKGQVINLDEDDSGWSTISRKRHRGGGSVSGREAPPPVGTQRGKMPSSPHVGGTSGGVSGVRMASRERNPIPFHVRSIPRPQDRFDERVDNSNTLVQHPSKTWMDCYPDVVLPSTSADESAPRHPLEVELQEMAYAQGLLNPLINPRVPESLAKTPFTLVDSIAGLKSMVMKLQSETEIAVDLENHHYRSFQGLTCLMQISSRSEDFVVDTLELRSHIGPHLCKIFCNPAIQKVMHGSERDIIWLQRDFGIYVCNLFDTGEASRVLGLERHGLAYLLEKFCDIEADKRYQLADWRIRPLPQEMLRYARCDTHYLLYIHDRLKEQLIAARIDVAEALDPLLEVYRRSRDLCLKLYEKDTIKEKSYLQVYGLHEKQFSPEQLAVMEGLYFWRDEIARSEDESTGYVLPNHLLLKIAEEMPDSTRSLNAMLTSRHSLVTLNAVAIIDIISRSRKQAQALLQNENRAMGIDKTESAEEAEKDKCHVPNVFPLKISWEDEALDSPESSKATIGLKEGDTEMIPLQTELCSNKVTSDGQLQYSVNNNAIIKRAKTGSLFSKTLDKTVGANNGDMDICNTPSSLFISEALASESEASLDVLEPKNVASVVKVSKKPPGGMASMLSSSRSSKKQEKIKASSISNCEEVEAKLKADRIKASVVLPFHTFSGGSPTLSSCSSRKSNELIGIHSEGEKCENVEYPSSLVDCQSGEEDHASECYEEIITLEPEISLPSPNPPREEKDGNEIIAIGNEEKGGIIMDTDGSSSRKWWPCLVDSSPRQDERVESAMDSGIPPSISEKYWGSSRGYSSMNSRQPAPHIEEPFDYEMAAASAKYKNMFDRKHFSLNDNCGRGRGLKRNPPPEHIAEDERSDSKAFDPLRRLRGELKPDGFQPGKRRQVFPRSGNKTGVFRN